MTCPVCGGPTRVYETRHRYGGVIRRRICRGPRCAYAFKTREDPLPGDGHYVALEGEDEKKEERK